MTPLLTTAPLLTIVPMRTMSPTLTTSPPGDTVSTEPDGTVSWASRYSENPVWTVRSLAEAQMPPSP